MATAPNPMTDRSTFQVFNRTELTRRLVGKLKRDEAVIGGIGNTNFDLFAAGHRPQNFYMLGSMGLAVPIALGVALAQPERGVIALEGDGSILMSLGCVRKTSPSSSWTTVSTRSPASSRRRARA
jgi:thiamine pyrophosphate-dependent acetolactate synthase large subunit-like protein